MTEQEFQNKLKEIYVQVTEANNRLIFLSAQLKACLTDFAPAPQIGSAGDYTQPTNSDK
jgi:hypothetical protein